MLEYWARVRAGVEPAPRPGAEAAVNKRRCAHLQSHIGDVLSGEGSTSRRTGAEDGEDAAGALVSRWGRWLSVALHRANARNLRAALGCEGPRRKRAERLAAELGIDRDSLTPEVLREAAREVQRSPREGFTSPEEQLLTAVRAAGGDEALHGFVLDFRNLFVDTLAPSHLPPGWSLEHQRRRT